MTITLLQDLTLPKTTSDPFLHRVTARHRSLWRSHHLWIHYTGNLVSSATTFRECSNFIQIVVVFVTRVSPLDTELPAKFKSCTALWVWTQLVLYGTRNNKHTLSFLCCMTHPSPTWTWKAETEWTTALVCPWWCFKTISPTSQEIAQSRPNRGGCSPGMDNMENIKNSSKGAERA